WPARWLRRSRSAATSSCVARSAAAGGAGCPGCGAMAAAGGGRLVAPPSAPWPARARGKNRSGGGGRSATKDDERAGKDEAAEAVVFVDGEDDEAAIDGDDLSGFRGLVLDLSYRPVNVVCWKRAICLEFMAKADVLEYYDQTVSSPSGSFYIPAVLRVPELLQVVKRRRVKHSLSRKNILYRDGFTCQYCSSVDNLTIDHVIPTARGGKWEWENLVTACSRCNSRKGQKTVEQANMKLLKVPKAPKEFDILAVPLTKAAFRTLKRSQGLPEEWLQYLARPSP
uniref:HNH nuclease domain-containing protein n=1 Tax=Oryza glaberrima TaxID=4538 RepID=I1Q8E1_ORYGL